MALAYATTAEYVEWSGTPAPADVERYLRSASSLVRYATRAAVYDVDATGKPEAGSDAADAFRDATCAQVETWFALGVDPVKGAADDSAQVVSSESKSINGATVSRQYVAYASQAEARQKAATQLCQESRTVLSNAGLIVSYVNTQGV